MDGMIQDPEHCEQLAYSVNRKCVADSKERCQQAILSSCLCSWKNVLQNMEHEQQQAEGPDEGA